MTVIAISGMPGVGKSTIAKHLAIAIGAEELVHVDSLRSLLRCLGEDSLRTDTSHTAWQRCNSNPLDGFRAYARSWTPLLIDYVKKSEALGKTIIMEGVQLYPEVFEQLPAENKRNWYLTCTREEREYRISQKLLSRKIPYNIWHSNLDIICSIDEWVCTKFPQYVVENRSIEKTIAHIVGEYHD